MRLGTAAVSDPFARNQPPTVRSSERPISVPSTPKPRLNPLATQHPGDPPCLSEGMIWRWLGDRASRSRLGAAAGRAYSQKSAPASSRHSEWYRDMIPGMIPIALLGSTVYFVSRIQPAVPSKERTADPFRRAYNLHAQNSRTRNRWSRPRNAFPSLKRVSNTSNRR